MEEPVKKKKKEELLSREARELMEEHKLTRREARNITLTTNTLEVIMATKFDSIDE